MSGNTDSNWVNMMNGGSALGPLSYQKPAGSSVPPPMPRTTQPPGGITGTPRQSLVRQAQPDIIPTPQNTAPAAAETGGDMGVAEAGPDPKEDGKERGPHSNTGANKVPELAEPDVGSARESDFRPDLGKYNLVVVRDKDIATRPEHVREGLKHSPSGKLPLSRETFYLTTHRLAEKAGVPPHAKGSVMIKADALGRPVQPLASFAMANGHHEKAEGEAEDKQTNMLMKTLAGSTTLLVIVVVILAVMLYKAKTKKYKADKYLDDYERKRSRH
jgi:hypothetical protein